MANPKTAEEWKQAAENFKEERKTIIANIATAKAAQAEKNAQSLALFKQAQEAKQKGDTATYESLTEQRTALKEEASSLGSDIGQLQDDLKNNTINISNANDWAAQAETGAPNTSPNTPPATDKPNTPPTAVPPTTTVPATTEAANVAPSSVATTTAPVDTTDPLANPLTPAPAVDPQTGLTTASSEQLAADYGVSTPEPPQGSIATDTTDPVGLGQHTSTIADDPYNLNGPPAYDDAAMPTEADVIASQNASVTQGFKDNANQQFTIAQQRKTVNNGDWRVKLRLAPSANYLYLDPDAKSGILAPLAVSDGIIFPYTPKIETAYKANYNSYSYDLTHSNYRGYFYQNSYVDAVNISCPFTAQSTDEANYLLAVIHFFRSVTKMFYGQDTQRGAPPPLVYLSGLGEYQFNDHACVVSSFNYSLPADVDYIRSGSPNINNTNLSTRRPLSSGGSSIFGGLLGGALNRLANAGAPKGGVTAPPPPPTLGLDRPTYVPTKMDISITLLPIQSRAQVSKQFSVKDFANGNLLKGGFW
jgi:hypothetical protein